ncbi:MAG: hypothetical protein D3906_00740 [Candidatus Electrothrix sp. AUS1_2]|nr:hypothetical protein [Candidatus Electrothrix sp. AUS1_2]
MIRYAGEPFGGYLLLPMKEIWLLLFDRRNLFRNGSVKTNREAAKFIRNPHIGGTAGAEAAPCSYLPFLEGVNRLGGGGT